MLISCSVVCYRNPASQIARVLQSLAASVGPGAPQLALTLIENSPRNELAELARQFGANYIHFPANPGFGAAHNLAIRHALAIGTSYHLVLNPDTYFSGDVIPTLVDFMERHRDVGLVMPDIRYPDGRRQYLCKLLPSPIDLLLRRFWPALYKHSGRLEKYELRKSGYAQIMDVPALSGCFMLMRTAILREVGGFDERFFLYFEDFDLSRRIGQLARTIYFPYVSIVHTCGKGSYSESKWKLLYYHCQSAIRYFNKWGWLSDQQKKAINRAVLQRIELEVTVDQQDGRDSLPG